MDPHACFDVASLNGGKGIAAPRSVVRPSYLCFLQIGRFGGKGIRTPDIQLAKLALYQLSYAPALLNAECRLRNAECKSGEHSDKIRSIREIRGWFLYRDEKGWKVPSALGRTAQYETILGCFARAMSRIRKPFRPE